MMLKKLFNKFKKARGIGVYDKTGKEIREGDIVKGKTAGWNLFSCMTGVVEFVQGSFCVYGDVESNTDGRKRRFIISELKDIEILS